MTIDDTLLSRLETLSALSVAPEKREAITGQLAQIVSFVENLSELDGALGAMDVHAQGSLALRDDTVVDSSWAFDRLAPHAPAVDEHAFVVPKIVE